MTLQEKINSIIIDKTKDPIKTREFINKIEALATTSEVKAMALIDGVIGKLTIDNPSAIKTVTMSTEQAKRKISKLKTLKAIVPKKADIDKIEAQIKKQYPSWTDAKIRDLAQLRIDAQISRAESFNKMLETLEKSEFYGNNELSTASIDKGRTRSLSKDASQRAITEKDEVKKYKRVSKRGAKNQYGTTKGGKVYYEYRMNRRDVDDKIRLATGGVLGQDVTYKYYDEQRTGTITEELPNGYEVSSKWGTVLVTPKEVISINAPKKNRFSFFKDGGGVGIPNADKMFHLPYEIAVYVPSTKDVDKTITATELRARVKEVEKYLTETFGGFTSSEKVGGYLSSKSAIITEKVVPVTAFSSLNDFTANKSKLINKMSVWAKKWGQEAIGFEFEGDLYYVPQKFKVGGTLKATYIPRRDIKMLTTVWGNNIRGKDLIDGAYTKRKNVKTAPKVARTQFEEETFEYKTGGLIAYSNDDYKVKKIGSFSSISEAKKFAKTNKSKYDTIIFEDEFGDNIVVTKSDTLKDIDWLFSEQYAKGGGLNEATYIPRRDIKMLTTVWGNNIRGKDLIDGAYTKRKNVKTAPKVARTQFEEETFEYNKGGNIHLRGGIPKAGSKKLFDLQYGDVFQITAKNHTATGSFFVYIGLSNAYNVSLKVKDFPSLNKNEKYIGGVKDGEIRILSRGEAGAMLMNYQTNNNFYKKGGGLTEATYIPRRDIKSLETVWGNNIRGKDLIDGAYTKRRNIKTAPKVARTQFEEETYEYAKGGRMGNVRLKKFATGSRISSDDTPKVWVGEWSLYNEGKLIGEWIDLSDYEDGLEVMAKIQALLDKWTKETNELREEYAIFDYENFPKALYSEGMGEAEFDKIITAYKLSSSMDIPMDVLASLMTEYSLNDANELEEFVNERYVGYFENNSDLGEHLVEMYGGVENMPKHTLEMYFDFDKYGRDEEINSLNDYEGYYFYNN
jgi:antirestriction protein